MTGIILVNFGGPRSQKEVVPFLMDIFKDLLPKFLKPAARLLAIIRSIKSKKMYLTIGGASPVVDLTIKQAAELQKIVGSNYKIYVGMKYGPPSIENAINNARRDGCKKIYLLPLFIYSSKYTDITKTLDVINISYNYPLYIKCQTEIIRSSATKDSHLIFSVHSIPTTSSEGRHYVKQVEESVSEIMKGFADMSHQIAYQSAPSPIGWIKPSIKTVLKQLTNQRANAPTHCLIVPLGFACENLETMYELDKLYIPYAKKMGLNVSRTAALNSHPLFIDMLARLVLDSH